ncbi:C4-type zinc ribbon domain-containing protein [Klenkia sp. LSe6-5]|uniref:C4-type zinc ribbon domain-containing protein n=1 Tax=Klenkia sesuvii TaxID=3103137 RepID=A0ABU8DSM4_9ACTN
MQADHFDQQKLLALAAEDVALAQLAHRRRTLPENAAVSAAEEAQREFAADVVRAETEVRDLDREQKRIEADVESVRARSARDQQRLDSGAATPKEMTSLQQEMASLARRQGDLEDQVLEIMERREAADATLATAQAGLAGARADQAAAEQARDAALAEIAEGEQEHGAKRAEVAGTVSSPLLAVYERVATQTGSTGAAALHARRCEGCRIELYGTELAAARNADPHTVLRCENCNRILVRTAESGL